MIESRQLTTASTKRRSGDGESKEITIEAATPDEAITEFVRENESELVSMTKPLTGRESIATIRKNDSVYLLRVYAA